MDYCEICWDDWLAVFCGGLRVLVVSLGNSFLCEFVVV